MRLPAPFLALAVACCALTGCATADTSDRGAGAVRMPANVVTAELKAVPTALPAVPLRDLAGKEQRLEAAVAGKVALVSFWATWCDACVAEMDALNRLDARVRTSGGVVVGVAIGEPREKVAAFAREHGLAYAQLLDEELKLADALGQKRLPVTLVLDRAGRVVWSGGALDERALSAFRAALAGPG